MAADSAPDSSTISSPVVVLSADLFFGMRIRNALKQMGLTTVLAKTITEFDDALRQRDPAPVLALVDFNNAVDWPAVSAAITASDDLPTIAFGPHTDTEGFRQAREAGVTRVISNGAFTSQLPDLIEKYARSST